MGMISGIVSCAYMSFDTYHWLQGQQSRGQGAAAEEPAGVPMELVRLAGAGHAAGQR